MNSGKKIEKAIRELRLSQDEIDRISMSNLNKICEMANVSLLELMTYLRSRKERGR